MKVIAITGGIGSGKSVVSQLLRTMGHQVYDCDERAKYVMTHDAQLRAELTSLFGPETYTLQADGTLQLNKPYLSACIFGNASLLAQMNACVHPAVARDIRRQMAAHPGLERFYYESAILFEADFGKLVQPDEVWTVSAPLETRIQRAMLRDHASRDRIMSRIASQLPQEVKERRADHIIVNDDRHSVIDQVRELC